MHSYPILPYSSFLLLCCSTASVALLGSTTFITLVAIQDSLVCHLPFGTTGPILVATLLLYFIPYPLG